ncbi:MAG: hypothetical protein ACPGTS_02125 [Minisyncoccia bacterium]
MTAETRNTIIGLLAVAAVALMVGIWIGSETDIVSMDIENAETKQEMKSEVMENTEMMMEKEAMVEGEVMVEKEA